MSDTAFIGTYVDVSLQGEANHSECHENKGEGDGPKHCQDRKILPAVRRSAGLVSFEFWKEKILEIHHAANDVTKIETRQQDGVPVATRQ